MVWSRLLDILPFFRTRQALSRVARSLREHRAEILRLRRRIHLQEQRIDAEKRKRRNLQKRLQRIRASHVRRADRRTETRRHRLVVFDHIPKTAGTTFRRSYLTCALRADERWILAGGEANQQDRERFLATPPAERARVRVVAGHHVESLRPHLPGARFVTVVRDPVQRAISSYLHVMFHAGAETSRAALRVEQPTLAQFAQRYETPNVQSRVLLGEDHDDLPPDEIRTRLDSRYALIGYTEAFDEFVFLLHLSEGLPLCLYNNRLVRAERERFVPSPEDLEVLR